MLVRACEHTVTGSTEVVLSGPATTLGGRRDHTCASLDDSGAVVCWGRNNVGQITQTSLGSTRASARCTTLRGPTPRR